LEPDPASGTVNPPVPTTSQYPLAAAPANSNTLFTGYNYDSLNHLATVGGAPVIHAVSMQRSVGCTMQTQTRDFNYDATTQRLTSATNPENGTVYYYYNAHGTLHQKRYGTAGKAQGYDYDTYQRLSKIYPQCHRTSLNAFFLRCQ
jgi:hypothetical protein